MTITLEIGLALLDVPASLLNLPCGVHGGFAAFGLNLVPASVGDPASLPALEALRRRSLTTTTRPAPVAGKRPGASEEAPT